MISINKHLKLLGMKVRDRVTGAEGVCVSLSFDLYGCIQVYMDRGLDKDGKRREAGWFDISRMEIIGKKPVMDPPDYQWTPEAVSAGKKGPAEKSAPNCF